MRTVEENKTKPTVISFWHILYGSIFIGAFFTAKYPIGQIVIGSIFLLYLIPILLRPKHFLSLSIDDENIVIKKNVGFRRKIYSFNIKDFCWFLIDEGENPLGYPYMTYRSNVSHKIYYTLQLGYKKGEKINMVFRDNNNRASAIKLLNEYLINKSVRTEFRIGEQDPAYNDLIQLVEKKYSLTLPIIKRGTWEKDEKFIHFDGKKYT